MFCYYSLRWGNILCCNYFCRLSQLTVACNLFLSFRFEMSQVPCPECGVKAHLSIPEVMYLSKWHASVQYIVKFMTKCTKINVFVLFVSMWVIL